MPTFALTIAAPRSARFRELQHDAWSRTTTPLAEISETARACATENHRVGRRSGATVAAIAAREAALLVWLEGRKVRTVDVAERLGLSMSSAGNLLAKLRRAGKVTIVGREAGAGNPALWGAR